MEKHVGKINNLKKKFPRISRIITDPISSCLAGLRGARKTSLIWFLTSILLIPIGFVGANTYSAYKEREVILKEREKITKEIAFWQEVVQKHSGYRDGYFTLALLEYQLGDRKKAQEYVKKTLILDPNFERGRILEGILDK